MGRSDDPHLARVLLLPARPPTGWSRFIPGPAGAAESLSAPGSVGRDRRRNPELREHAARCGSAAGQSRRSTRASISSSPSTNAIKLVGLIRLHWRGLSGGAVVWGEIERFFEDLRRREARMPSLTFAVVKARGPAFRGRAHHRLRSARSPTPIAGEAIQSVALRCQILIEAAQAPLRSGRARLSARPVRRTRSLEPDAAFASLDSRGNYRARVSETALSSNCPCPALSISTWPPPSISTPPSAKTRAALFPVQRNHLLSRRRRRAADRPDRLGSGGALPSARARLARDDGPLLSRIAPGSACAATSSSASTNTSASRASPPGKKPSKACCQHREGSRIMNFEPLEKIANAVLYEGFLLYPYRSLRDQESAALALRHTRPARRRAIRRRCRPSVWSKPAATPSLDVKIRFLQDEIERELTFPGVPWTQRGKPAPSLFRPSTATWKSNRTRVAEHALPLHRAHPQPAPIGRPPALRMLSTHTLLAVQDGAFVSLLDPPGRIPRRGRRLPQYRHVAGSRRARRRAPPDALVADHPLRLPADRPRKPGDFFDGTEIDEMLTLRVLTLSDEEKSEVRAGDERGREHPGPHRRPAARSGRQAARRHSRPAQRVKTAVPRRRSRPPAPPQEEPTSSISRSMAKSPSSNRSSAISKTASTSR